MGSSKLRVSKQTGVFTQKKNMIFMKNRAALSVVLCLLAVTFGRKQRLTADDDVKRLKLSFEDAEKWAENDPFMLTCLEAKTNMKKWCSNSKLYNKFCKVQKHRNKVVYQRAIGSDKCQYLSWKDPGGKTYCNIKIKMQAEAICETGATLKSNSKKACPKEWYTLMSAEEFCIFGRFDS